MEAVHAGAERTTSSASTCDEPQAVHTHCANRNGSGITPIHTAHHTPFHTPFTPHSHRLRRDAAAWSVARARIIILRAGDERSARAETR